MMTVQMFCQMALLLTLYLKHATEYNSSALFLHFYKEIIVSEETKFLYQNLVPGEDF